MSTAANSQYMTHEPSQRETFLSLPVECQELILIHLEPLVLLFIAQYLPPLAKTALGPYVLAHHFSTSGRGCSRTQMRKILAKLTEPERKDLLKRSVSWGRFFGKKPHSVDIPLDAPARKRWRETRMLSPRGKISAGITPTHFVIEDHARELIMFREPLLWQHGELSNAVASDDRYQARCLQDSQFWFGNNYAIAIERPKPTTQKAQQGILLVVECIAIGPLFPWSNFPVLRRICQHQVLKFGRGDSTEEDSIPIVPEYEICLPQDGRLTFEVFGRASSHPYREYRANRYACHLGRLERWNLPDLFQERPPVVLDRVAGYFRGARWHLYVSECATVGGVRGAPLDLAARKSFSPLPGRPRLRKKQKWGASSDKVHPFIFLPVKAAYRGNYLNDLLYHNGSYAWYCLNYKSLWYMHAYDSKRELWIKWPEEYCIAMEYQDGQLFWVYESTSGSFAFTDGAGLWHRVAVDGDLVIPGSPASNVWPA